MVIEINTKSPSPLYEQLRDQIVLGIASKKLVPGEVLPSVRNLAADLGINFHTVNKAYAILCEENFVIMDRQKGAVIAPAVPVDDAFRSKISQRLMLTAAESVCRALSEDDFISLCIESYRKSINK